MKDDNRVPITVTSMAEMTVPAPRDRKSPGYPPYRHNCVPARNRITRVLRANDRSWKAHMSRSLRRKGAVARR